MNHAGPNSFAIQVRVLFGITKTFHFRILFLALRQRSDFILDCVLLEFISLPLFLVLTETTRPKTQTKLLDLAVVRSGLII